MFLVCTYGVYQEGGGVTQVLLVHILHSGGFFLCHFLEMLFMFCLLTKHYYAFIMFLKSMTNVY